MSFLAYIFFLLWFICAIYLSFYIPAKVILSKYIDKLVGGFERTTIYLVVGMVLWTYQGFVFGYLGLRFLSYIYLIFFIYIYIRRYGLSIVQLKNSNYISYKLRTIARLKDKVYILILSIIFILGIFGQVQSFFITGIQFPDGIHIFTSSSDDAMWHSSLISQLVRRFPPFEPGLVGITVYNYHYLSNFVFAELIRVFYLPLLPTQYMFGYCLVSFLLGAVAYTLANVLKFSKASTILFVYIQYFASDIIYLLTFITQRVFTFTVHPLEDGTMFLENPPRALSIVVTLCALVLFTLWVRTKKVLLGIILAMLFGSLIGFKVHTGIALLGGLVCLGCYYLYKRQFSSLYLPFLSIVFSCLIYFPVNYKSGSLLFAPFEMSRMFAGQVPLGISTFELARQIYNADSKLLQVLRMDLVMLFLFLFFQFGIKNIGFIPLRSTIRQIGTKQAILIYTSIGTAIVLGTFFLQPVAHADIFNFYLAGSFLLAIPFAVTLGSWLQRGNMLIRVFIVLFIFFATLPRFVYKTEGFTNYLQKTPAIIKNGELQAMDYIKRHTKESDIVLVLNKGQWDSMYAYVSIFTNRDMFLSGQIILGRHGIPFSERQHIVDTIAQSNDSKLVKRLLHENNIDILYLYGSPVPNSGIAKLQLEKIYGNEMITVLKVDR